LARFAVCGSRSLDLSSAHPHRLVRCPSPFVPCCSSCIWCSVDALREQRNGSGVSRVSRDERRVYPIPYARILGTLCGGWFVSRQPLQLISILVIIFAAGTEDDARAFLALQRPEIFDIGQEFVCPSRRFLMKSRSLARLLAHSQPNPDARRDRWRSSSSVAPIWSRTSTRWPATWRRTPSPVLTLSGATPRPLTPSPVHSLATTLAC